MTLAITPLPATALTCGTKIRLAGTAYWVRRATPCTAPAPGGGTMPATEIELDDHTILTVPDGQDVQVIGRLAEAVL